MKKILDYFTWGFLFLFAIPSVLIVASWQSLPGDTMYPVKLGFEDVLLFFVKPSYAASGTLSVKYTERRFAEAKKLLADKNSIEGLSYLERQVSTTRAMIAKAPNTAAQKHLARTYLTTLREVTTELEAQKQRGTQETQESKTAASSEAVTQEIEESQQVLAQTIVELEEITQEGEEDHGNGKKDKDKEKESDKGNDGASRGQGNGRGNSD